MNPKIQRNFEVFSPCDFIARITQDIPDKSFQIVRYYGWYSNKMQRLKRADPEAVAAPEVDVIDVSAFKLRRIPSKKWRELIKKFREADPLLCPRCQHPAMETPASCFNFRPMPRRAESNFLSTYSRIPRLSSSSD